jgi:hypothetical protein
MKRMQEIAGAAIIKICVVHRMLLTLALQMNMAGGDVPRAVSQARTALDILRALQ